MSYMGGFKYLVRVDIKWIQEPMSIPKFSLTSCGWVSFQGEKLAWNKITTHINFLQKQLIWTTLIQSWRLMYRIIVAHTNTTIWCSLWAVHPWDKVSMSFTRMAHACERRWRKTNELAMIQLGFCAGHWVLEPWAPKSWAAHNWFLMTKNSHSGVSVLFELCPYSVGGTVHEHFVRALLQMTAGQLVTNELVGFEKYPVEVQGFRKITNRSGGFCRRHLKINEEESKNHNM